ncbi:MAG TPA: hypothetical protein VIX89_08450 [Bryobacteraceae bacterium]
MHQLDLVFVMLAMAAALPAWLIPYSGAKEETQTALASRIEVVYTTDAKPDQVVTHYQHLLEAAGLPFLPSFDGIGTSIRVASAECDLLIKIREQGAGTQARVSCAAKSTSSSNIAVTPMEERIRQGDEHTRRVLADAEARHKQGIQKMEVYDQPVNGRARKKK